MLVLKKHPENLGSLGAEVDLDPKYQPGMEETLLFDDNKHY